jgi:hypothetical protein
MPADPRRVKELFGAAIDLAGPAERQALFDRECAGDAVVRQQVERLSVAHLSPAPAPGQLRPWLVLRQSRHAIPERR